MKYTTAEFRKNLREAFNQAEHGEPVVVDRHGKTFVLKCKEAKVDIPDYRQEFTVQTKKDNEDYTLVPPAPHPGPDIATAQVPREDVPVKNIAGADAPIHKDNKDYSTCSHGNVKGFCKKGCK